MVTRVLVMIWILTKDNDSSGTHCAARWQTLFSYFKSFKSPVWYANCLCNSPTMLRKVMVLSLILAFRHLLHLVDFSHIKKRLLHYWNAHPRNDIRVFACFCIFRLNMWWICQRDHTKRQSKIFPVIPFISAMKYQPKYALLPEFSKR